MKIRLIPILYFKNGSLVRSENFDLHRILGDPFIQVERYNSWNIDEIIYIDISNKDEKFIIKNKTFQNQISFFDVIKKASSSCFSPIVFGGGIKNINDAKKYFQNGADKISINDVALNNPKIISEFANIFGSQSIIVSIDIKKDNGKYKIFSHKKNETLEINFLEYISEVEKRGAGEILLNSVDNDGAAKGYDIELIKLVNEKIDIPLIPCGGAGSFEHFEQLLQKTDLNAIAAGNIFNFTERSYEKAKKFLKNKGFNFR
jgi:imidazole glycerol-phosphate synthase subunit HisF